MITIPSAIAHRRERRDVRERIYPAAPASGGHTAGQVIRRRAALLIVTLVLVFSTVVRRHEIGRAAATAIHAHLGWLALGLVLSMISIAFAARTQQRMVRAGGSGIPFRRMIALAYIANAINWTLPAGTLMSASYGLRRLRGWGVAAAPAGFALAASGVLSSLTFVAVAVVGGLLTGDLTVSAIAGSVVTLAGVCVLAVTWWCWPTVMDTVASKVLHLLNRVARRDPSAGQTTLRHFLDELATIRPTRLQWSAGAACAALNWCADLLCLGACLGAAGVEDANAALLVITFVAGAAASGLSFVPFGLGIVDVAMVLTLTTGGVNAISASAGVLLYRLVSCVVPVLVGWLLKLGTDRSLSSGEAALAVRSDSPSESS